MKLKTTLRFLSTGVLLYLLVDAFVNIDFAFSKNNAYTSMQKMEIDSMHNIELVKEKGKSHLDTIRRVHRKYSDKSVVNFWLVTGLIFIQVFLFINRRKLQ